LHHIATELPEWWWMWVVTRFKKRRKLILLNYKRKSIPSI